MRRAVVAIVSVLVAMGVLDALWLGTMIPLLYEPELGHLLAPSPTLLPAGIFYVLYSAGVSLFVVLPSLDRGRPLLPTMRFGGAFGLVAYGTYDLTNAATLDGWPWSIVIVDMAWGAALTATVSLVAVWVARRFG
jgi:uncharacterized membrane protein